MDEEIVWGDNAGPAPQAGATPADAGENVLVRGRVRAVEGAVAVLELGGSLLLLDLPGPLPPGTTGSWIELRLRRATVSLWP